MASISLAGYTFDYIVDVLFSEGSECSEPEFLNQGTVPVVGVELDYNIWTRTPFKMAYILRVTSQQKYVLDQIVSSGSTVNLTDAKYSLNITVWMSKLEAEWNPNNHNYPWTVIIDIIKVV